MHQQIIYDRLGNKFDGIHKNVESEHPGIEIYDKKGNKLYELYKKKELPDEKELFDKN